MLYPYDFDSFELAGLAGSLLVSLIGLIICSLPCAKVLSCHNFRKNHEASHELWYHKLGMPGVVDTHDTKLHKQCFSHTVLLCPKFSGQGKFWSHFSVIEIWHPRVQIAWHSLTYIFWGCWANDGFTFRDSLLTSSLALLWVSLVLVQASPFRSHILKTCLPGTFLMANSQAHWYAQPLESDNNWIHLFFQIKHISFILQPDDLHTCCITACSLAFEERIKNFQGFQRWHALVHRRVLSRIQACLPSFRENLASQARKMLQGSLSRLGRTFRNAFPNHHAKYTQTQKHYVGISNRGC